MFGKSKLKEHRIKLKIIEIIKINLELFISPN
jgi:hypothetical protein